MVKPVEVTRKKESQEARLKRLMGKNSPQHAFNAMLWRQITNKGGLISIKGTDLRKIPDTAMLKGDWDEATQSFIIRAVLSQSNIITPANNGIILR